MDYSAANNGVWEFIILLGVLALALGIVTGTSTSCWHSIHVGHSLVSSRSTTSPASSTVTPSSHLK